MVLPPKHVYSAVVKNASGKDIEVVATYALPNETTEKVTITVAAGAEGTFDEKTVEVAAATHIAFISNIAVTGGASVDAPFNVTSPVKGHVFTVDAELKVQN